MGASNQDVTPNDTTDRWFHENALVIRGDSAFIDKWPVVFYKNDTKRYSSSDGGVYAYRGKIIKTSSGQIKLKMLLVTHDYALLPYRLKNPGDSVLVKSMDAISTSRFHELYEPDSTAWKTEYPLLRRSDTLLIDGVEYYRQRNNKRPKD